jgi:hypothetical protein
MIIAREKKKNNIAEYILYMFQIEDLIRANNLDIVTIKKTVISGFKQPEKVLKEMTVWYQGLIDQLKKEKKEKSGHLTSITVYIDELDKLHKNLLSSPEELKYIEAYSLAKPNIIQLRSVSENRAASDIGICFHGLYGLLMLKLQGKPINNETAQAIGTFSNLLALLSDKYKTSY